jgi:hypothetical protein
MLYLFACRKRHCDISECLHQQAPPDVEIVMVEIDILPGDVLKAAIFGRILADIAQGLYDIALHRRGPQPVRSRQHLGVFPWLEGDDLMRCTTGSILVRKSIECAVAIFATGDHSIWEHLADQQDGEARRRPRRRHRDAAPVRPQG